MRFLPLYLISLTACWLCVDTTSGWSYHWLTAPILTVFLICWPTTYLPHRLREVVQFVLGELFVIICIVDCYCQEFFETPITPQILSNVLLSDIQETSEFFSSFVSYNILSHWRIAALFLLAIAIPFALFLLRKPIKTSSTTKKVCIILLGICLICELPSTYKFAQLFFHHNNLQKIEGLIFRHYHEEIPTPLHRFAFSWYSLKQSSRVLEDIKRSTFSAKIDSCSHLSPNIVLIIGESYNKHHSTIYGYKHPTTPLQQKRLDGNELMVFKDVVTPWNITSNVFLDIFSVWEYGTTNAIGSMPLFPILFRRADYSVNFFSNQYLLKGFRKGVTNQAGHFFLADSETSDSLFSFRNRKPSKYDMGLIGKVEEFKKTHNMAQYTLDIIHLKGQHFDYNMRYPKSEGIFSIDNYADRTIDKEAKTILMHYDNAIHYNDMVLDSILRIYETEDAIVLFIADHGEEAYDDLPVHGRLFQEPIAAQARNEYEIPMWIWCSEVYRHNHPEVIRCIEQAREKPFMTDRIPQILLYLAGISCQWRNEKDNLLSPQYQNKQRIIGGNTDYDILIKDK